MMIRKIIYSDYNYYNNNHSNSKLRSDFFAYINPKSLPFSSRYSYPKQNVRGYIRSMGTLRNSAIDNISNMNISDEEKRFRRKFDLMEMDENRLKMKMELESKRKRKEDNKESHTFTNNDNNNDSNNNDINKKKKNNPSNNQSNN